MAYGNYPVIIWGDATSGFLVRRLPLHQNEDGRMVQPLIVQLENSVLKNLGIKLELEGVNEDGEPGGIFVKCEYTEEFIKSPVPMGDYNLLVFITCGFFGQKTVLTETYKELGIVINRVLVENSALRAENLSLMHKLRNTMANYTNMIKLWKEMAESAKTGAEFVEEDEDQEEKRGEAA